MTDSPIKDVQIERTLQAPVSLVWSMWTDPEHFKAWYGPGGATIPVAEFDLTIGGRRLVCMAMETPNGPMQMWFVGEHQEIDVDVRLVYTESMSDEDGNIMNPAMMGMPEGHPETTEVQVQLAEVDGGTTMTLTHVGVPADSQGAGGWGMAIDKMVAHLETLAG